MADIDFTKDVTEHLEKDRQRRQQLVLLGIPCQILFFAVGTAYPQSDYLLLQFIPLVLLLRLFILKTINVVCPTDDDVRLFLSATLTFRALRDVRNDMTGDKVRIRLRSKYRNIQWPFPILIFEQRWRSETNQMFLVIGPGCHWISGGSIWRPWHWASGNNCDLGLARANTSDGRTRYSLSLKTPTGSWALRFKNKEARDAAYLALNTIRALDKNLEETKRSSSPRASSSRNDLVQPPPADTQGAWHDVLCVSSSASLEEIKAAYHQAIKRCHPDTVADRSEAIRQTAATEARQINQAYSEARIERGFN